MTENRNIYRDIQLCLKLWWISELRMVCSWRGLCNEPKGRLSSQPPPRPGGVVFGDRAERAQSAVAWEQTQRLWCEARIALSQAPTSRPPEGPIFPRSLHLQEHQKQSRDFTEKQDIRPHFNTRARPAVLLGWVHKSTDDEQPQWIND